MQKYKEINGNDYVKNSRTTINETMQSIQSMNSGTAFPTNNLFEGMKCYRTDLKKTYTLTDVENNTWVEDAHATLSDEATHAASATKLQTARSLNLGGAVTADAATFDGTANATINVKTLDATKLKGTASVSTTGNAATATKVVTTAAAGTSANIAEVTMASSDRARIRVSGAENAGELALETADDGNEAIVARQYTGTYTTPVRTAKILDESGNTSFPGTVVAPKFTGALNGNAATATKLSTERKINITGNATGSAGFDGTSDVNINVTVNSATKATNDGNGANIASTYVKKAGDTTTGKITFESTDINALPEVKKTSDDNMSGIRFSSKTQFLGAVGKRLSNGEDLLNLRSDNTTTDVVLDSRNYNNYAPTKTGGGASGTWGISITGNAASATTATKANTASSVAWSGVTGKPGTYPPSAHNHDSAYPSVTGTRASGTWGINISGNAASATTAGNVSEKIYYSADSPSVATNKLFTVKQAHKGEDNVPNNGLVIQSGPTGANYNGKLYITDNGNDGVWIGGIAGGKEVGWTRLVENKGTWGISITGNAASATTATKANTASSVAWSGVTGKPGTYPPSAHNHDSAYPSVTGTRASGTWGINISGNAASATNADKVDGYHASDIINRISAANTGGIVAASLTENGYAKFANGLILQWGTRTEPKVNDWVWVTTTFPITFASACFSVTCCDELTSTYDGDVESFVRNIKTNSVDIRYRSDHLGRNLRWLALGV